ncbi:glycoside hydrolase family 13 protein [Aureibaculum sp. 2210JD6-5]|uniref:glycoside hydrolase family 13 protein n=1 Tax=Aureibaculum sp. 2210JD6-5 TaxID=3103957 RepID=UPI002AAEC1AA|nr:glycoside hydrolase family 13 protein [Aureibaculum sp. 2210JD6-5]MDY7394457.1 glycoside hydrolase family 13 protein [Aureibaculum sp. 2210JD6-5]
MKKFLFIMIALGSNLNFAQIERIEPLNWWAGFENNNLQLLVKGENIGKAIPSISHDGVNLMSVNKGTSTNYLFLNLKINRDAKPGKFDIVFRQENNKDLKYSYELKARKKNANDYVGFDSSDAIYLITPDRFANGNAVNDKVTGLKDQTLNRAEDYNRHGGDIRGMINHLDYIKDMGFTAIWPTPLLTNDMSESSYHGYAITDFYQVDPRFGKLEAYVELAEKMKEKGMKLVMDQVANHCGIEHWWMKDLPFDDWINQQEKYKNNETVLKSNHRRTANQDLYASKIDKEQLNDGWFVDSMPDLNQKNPFMATYIIQNSIWWIETLELGGIRQDTYPYPDKDFMSDWAGAIMKEYPNFSIVGEEWSLNPLLVGYWQAGAKNKDGYESNLTSTMDFPMQNNIVQALNEEESWDQGLVKLYEGLANDFHYPSPENIMIFPDNHDMSRIYTQLGEDFTNTKMALATVLLLPRIPQIYYGTEVLISDVEKPGDHGLIRTDFPGGWPGDSVNAFTGEGLSNDQKDMQNFLKKVLNYRKSSEAIHNGKTIHFAPENGIYVLFRVGKDETVAMILNKNDQQVQLNLNRFKEMGLDKKPMKNIISEEEITWNSPFVMMEKGVVLLTTKM